MLNVRKFLKAIGLIPNASQTISAQGEIEYRSDLAKLSVHDGSSADSVVQENKSATLTNKVLSGNTATNLVNGAGTLNVNSTGVVTVPNTTDTLVGKATTDTLTNKTISGASNTLSNIPNSATTATNLNTPSTIVARDASGNFVAGTITGDITGNAGTAVAFTGSLSGDVTGFMGTTTVQQVGASTAVDVHTATNAANAATNLNTASTIVKRDASGNFSAGTITASLTGNVTGNVTGTSGSFTGPLAGDVTGTQGATVVSAVGGSTATNVHSAEVAANAATNLNTASTIVKRDASGNFSAGTITANLTGTVTGNATNVSGVVAPANGGTGVANSNTVTVSGGDLTLSSSAGASVTLPATGTLATLAGTETLTNKKLGDALTFTQITTPASPTTGLNKLYVKSDNKFYTLTSAGVETAVGSGSGGGGINYMSSNPSAETDTVGYTVSHNTVAGASPDSGFVTTGTNITWTRSTVSPLRGVASFLLTKDAFNRQGEQVYYPFTIDSADQAKVLNVSFDYAVNSGTYADADLTLWIYDVTNAQFIQPAGYKILSAATGLPVKQVSTTFQTAVNSVSYRLVIHCASTSALAYTVKFDNFAISPQVITQGTPVTDSASDTTIILENFGTATNTAFFKYRVGDKGILTGTFNSGITAAAAAAIDLPSGWTIDASKMPSNASGTVVGYLSRTAGANTFAGSSVGPFPIFYDGSTTNKLFIAQATASNQLVKSLANAFAASGDLLTFNLQPIPIQGWSSQVQMSSDTDTRVVAARMTVATGTLAGSENLVTFSNLVSDTHGAVTGKNTFTAPVQGFYAISASLPMASSFTTNQSAIVFIRVNGTDVLSGWQRAGGSVSVLIPSVSVPAYYLSAGDTVSVYSYSDAGGSFGAGADNGYFSIARVSGPSQIAASESVNASYESTSLSFTISTSDLIYSTSRFDTHGAYNISTGVYTVPTAGKYRAYAIYTEGTSGVGPGSYVAAGVYLNGVVKAKKKISFGATETVSTNKSADVSTILNCVAGDQIKFFYDQNCLSGASDGNAYDNYMTIERIGN